MSSNREKLQLWVRQALGDLGGEGLITDVMKRIWADHEHGLKQLGDTFYTWQYDARWAADQLRKTGHLSFRKEGPRNVWVLKK
jgi:hypothetical protein